MPTDKTCQRIDFVSQVPRDDDDDGDQAPQPPECPGCGRVMSRREAYEQGACNDCNGGAW